MNDNVLALKALYAALGGEASAVVGINTNAGMIAAIAAIAEPSTKLPTVSATDNGDVLTVVEGAWAKATPSSGDSSVICKGGVIATLDAQTGAGTVTLNDETVAGESAATLIQHFLDGGLVYLNIATKVNGQGEVDPTGTLNSLTIFTPAYQGGDVVWTYAPDSETLYTISGSESGWVIEIN